MDYDGGRDDNDKFAEYNQISFIYFRSSDY